MPPLGPGAGGVPPDSGYAKQRQGRPKPASVVEMGIAVIDTRECPQTPTRLTSVPLCSSERPNGLAAHQDTYLNPPTAVWWPPGCPVVRAHSNRGLRIIFCRMKTKPGALEAARLSASCVPGLVFTRQKMMRSPPFEWNPEAGHPGGHQTAVGGFKWASWCAASPLGRFEEHRGTGGSRVGVWGCSLVSMTAIPISATEAGFGRPWRY